MRLSCVFSRIWNRDSKALLIVFHTLVCVYYVWTTSEDRMSLSPSKKSATIWNRSCSTWRLDVTTLSRLLFRDRSRRPGNNATKCFFPSDDTDHKFVPLSTCSKEAENVLGTHLSFSHQTVRGFAYACSCENVPPSPLLILRLIHFLLLHLCAMSV